MASPLLDGDGNYSCEIVGEARRQAELRSICGTSDSFIEQECLALLIPNAADLNDVGVEINGRHVGSVSRSDAAEYHQALSRAGSFHQIFACRAIIRGTWSEHGDSSLSVALDLSWPPRFAADLFAADLDAGDDRFEPADDPPSRRRWRGLLGICLAGGTVSLALIFGIWLLPGENSRTADESSAVSTEARESVGFQPAQELVQATEQASQPNVCSDADTSAQAWDIVQNSGIIRSVTDSGSISVEETLWQRLPREDQIRFAFVGYCRALATGGSRSMLVIGAHDGQVKGSIVQGVWLDPAVR